MLKASLVAERFAVVKKQRNNEQAYVNPYKITIKIVTIVLKSTTMTFFQHMFSELVVATKYTSFMLGRKLKLVRH